MKPRGHFSLDGFFTAVFMLFGIPVLSLIGHRKDLAPLLMGVVGSSGGRIRGLVRCHLLE